MPKIKSSDTLTYIDDFGAQILRKNAFFWEKKIPTLVIFSEQITLSGTSTEMHLSLFLIKFQSNLANILHVVFICSGKQISFPEVGAWNFHCCNLKGSGRSKNSFSKYFDFLLIFYWLSIRIKINAVVGVSRSGNLISITSQENRQKESKIAKNFFSRGTLGPISKGSYAKYKVLRDILWSQGDSQVSK